MLSASRFCRIFVFWVTRAVSQPLFSLSHFLVPCLYYVHLAMCSGAVTSPPLSSVNINYRARHLNGRTPLAISQAQLGDEWVSPSCCECSVKKKKTLHKNVHFVLDVYFTSSCCPDAWHCNAIFILCTRQWLTLCHCVHTQRIVCALLSLNTMSLGTGSYVASSQLAWKSFLTEHSRTMTNYSTVFCKCYLGLKNSEPNLTTITIFFSFASVCRPFRRIYWCAPQTATSTCYTGMGLAVMGAKPSASLQSLSH